MLNVLSHFSVCIPRTNDVHEPVRAEVLRTNRSPAHNLDDLQKPSKKNDNLKGVIPPEKSSQSSPRSSNISFNIVELQSLYQLSKRINDSVELTVLACDKQQTIHSSVLVSYKYNESNPFTAEKNSERIIKSTVVENFICSVLNDLCSVSKVSSASKIMNMENALRYLSIFFDEISYARWGSDDERMDIFLIIIDLATYGLITSSSGTISCDNLKCHLIFVSSSIQLLSTQFNNICKQYSNNQDIFRLICCQILSRWVQWLSLSAKQLSAHIRTEDSLKQCLNLLLSLIRSIVSISSIINHLKSLKFELWPLLSIEFCCLVSLVINVMESYELFMLKLYRRQVIVLNNSLSLEDFKDTMKESAKWRRQLLVDSVIQVIGFDSDLSQIDDQTMTFYKSYQKYREENLSIDKLPSVPFLRSILMTQSSSNKRSHQSRNSLEVYFSVSHLKRLLHGLILMNSISNDDPFRVSDDQKKDLIESLTKSILRSLKQGPLANKQGLSDIPLNKFIFHYERVAASTSTALSSILIDILTAENIRDYDSCLDMVDKNLKNLCEYHRSNRRLQSMSSKRQGYSSRLSRPVSSATGYASDSAKDSDNNHFQLSKDALISNMSDFEFIPLETNQQRNRENHRNSRDGKSIIDAQSRQTDARPNREMSSDSEMENAQISRVVRRRSSNTKLLANPVCSVEDTEITAPQHQEVTRVERRHSLVNTLVIPVQPSKKSPRIPSESKLQQQVEIVKYNIDDKIDGLVQLKNGSSRWFPGTIRGVHEAEDSSFTYDILYDDGDEAFNVKPRDIRHTKRKIFQTSNQIPSNMTVPNLFSQLKTLSDINVLQTSSTITITNPPTIAVTQDAIVNMEAQETAFLKEPSVDSGSNRPASVLTGSLFASSPNGSSSDDCASPRSQGECSESSDDSNSNIFSIPSVFTGFNRSTTTRITAPHISLLVPKVPLDKIDQKSSSFAMAASTSLSSSLLQESNPYNDDKPDDEEGEEDAEFPLSPNYAEVTEIVTENPLLTKDFSLYSKEPDETNDDDSETVVLPFTGHISSKKQSGKKESSLNSPATGIALMGQGSNSHGVSHPLKPTKSALRLPSLSKVVSGANVITSRSKDDSRRYYDSSDDSRYTSRSNILSSRYIETSVTLTSGRSLTSPQTIKSEPVVSVPNASSHSDSRDVIPRGNNSSNYRSSSRNLGLGSQSDGSARDNTGETLFDERWVDLGWDKPYPMMLLTLLKRCFRNDSYLDTSICHQYTGTSSDHVPSLVSNGSEVSAFSIRNPSQSTNLQQVNYIYTIREYLESISSNKLQGSMALQSLVEYISLSPSRIALQPQLRVLKLLTPMLFQNCLIYHMPSLSRKIGDGGFGSVYRVCCPKGCGRFHIHRYYSMAQRQVHVSQLSVINPTLAISPIANKTVSKAWDDENKKRKRPSLSSQSSRLSFASDKPSHETNADDCYYAVKRINRERSIHDPVTLFNVYNEVTCLELLSVYSNQGICSLYDYGVNNGEYWFVMELGGCNLSEWRNLLHNDITNDLHNIYSSTYVEVNLTSMSSMPTSPQATSLLIETESPLVGLSLKNLIHCLLFYIDVAYIVQLVHSNDIAHFDIKCNNFILRHERLSFNKMIEAHQRNESSGAIFLTDFGEAIPYITDYREQVLQGKMKTHSRGTLPVQSPEQIAMSESKSVEMPSEKISELPSSSTQSKFQLPDRRSDIWSVGALLGELIIGNYLFADRPWPDLFIMLCMESFHPLPLDLFRSVINDLSVNDLKQRIEDLMTSTMKQFPQDRIQLKDLINQTKGIVTELINEYDTIMKQQPIRSPMKSVEDNDDEDNFNVQPITAPLSSVVIAPTGSSSSSSSHVRQAWTSSKIHPSGLNNDSELNSLSSASNHVKRKSGRPRGTISSRDRHSMNRSIISSLWSSSSSRDHSIASDVCSRLSTDLNDLISADAISDVGNDFMKGNESSRSSDHPKQFSVQQMLSLNPSPRVDQPMSIPSSLSTIKSNQTIKLRPCLIHLGNHLYIQLLSESITKETKNHWLNQELSTFDIFRDLSCLERLNELIVQSYDRSDQQNIYGAGLEEKLNRSHEQILNDIHSNPLTVEYQFIPHTTVNLGLGKLIRKKLKDNEHVTYEVPLFRSSENPSTSIFGINRSNEGMDNGSVNHSHSIDFQQLLKQSNVIIKKSKPWLNNHKIKDLQPCILFTLTPLSSSWNKMSHKSENEDNSKGKEKNKGGIVGPGELSTSIASSHYDDSHRGHGNNRISINDIREEYSVAQLTMIITIMNYLCLNQSKSSEEIQIKPEKLKKDGNSDANDSSKGNDSNVFLRNNERSESNKSVQLNDISASTQPKEKTKQQTTTQSSSPSQFRKFLSRFTLTKNPTRIPTGSTDFDSLTSSATVNARAMLNGTYNESTQLVNTTKTKLNNVHEEDSSDSVCVSEEDSHENYTAKYDYKYLSELCEVLLEGNPKQIECDDEDVEVRPQLISTGLNTKSDRMNDQFLQVYKIAPYLQRGCDPVLSQYLYQSFLSGSG